MIKKTKKQQALIIYKSKIMPYFDYGDIFLMGTHVITGDKLPKLQNRALRLVLGRDSRHNVWELHHEAMVPYIDKRRDCRLAYFVFNRRLHQQYIHVPARQLRQYEVPVFIFIEYKAEKSTFQTSVLFKGAKYWNQLPAVVRNIENYKSKEMILSNVR